MRKVYDKDFDDLEVVLPPKTIDRTERSTTGSKIIERRSGKSSVDSNLHYQSETSIAKPSATAGVINKVAEKSKKTLEDTPKSPKQNLGQ